MTIAQAILRAAQVNSHGNAILHNDRPTSWSCFADRIGRLSSGLRSMVDGRGARIAVLASNCPENLEIGLAIFWSGHILVPINTRLSEQEQNQVLELADCSVLFFDENHQARAAALLLENDQITGIALGSDAYRKLSQHDPVAPESMNFDEPAAIFFTGGTTGTPKGAEISHGSFVHQAIAMLNEVPFDTDTVYLHTTPLFHLATFGTGLSVILGAGCQTFLEEYTAHGVLASIRDNASDSLTLVPTMIQDLLDNTPPDQMHLLRRIKRINYGAAPISTALLERLVKEVPGVVLTQFYGQTELNGVCTVLRSEHHKLGEKYADKLRSVGCALPTASLRIVDENGNDLPTGSTGEILVSSFGKMTRYWRNEEMTRKTIRSGWVHTGDMGQLDHDGYLTLRGRYKDMIVTGGENVFAGEVENVLSQYPGVDEIAVIGVPDEKWGERVHACIIPEKGFELVDADLIAHCKNHIAGYKCPKTFSYRSTPFPMSGVGKIKKIDLLAELLAN